jgi:hypothetical protein
MILAKEITVWSTDFQPNHTYLMNDSMDKIIGYFKWNNPKDFTKFKNPLRFDTRYRKFKILQRYVEETDNGMSCTCIGHKYHGKCKHIEQVKNEHQ